MTKVDFYILSESYKDNRFAFACRIAEKAWNQGYRVLIATENESTSAEIDNQLWSFREKSFVPHAIMRRDVDTVLNPVLISHENNPGEEHGLLINLSEDVPTYFSRFERVVECVDNDDKVKQSGRVHYRFYKDHGYPIDSHNL